MLIRSHISTHRMYETLINYYKGDILPFGVMQMRHEIAGCCVDHGKKRVSDKNFAGITDNYLERSVYY